MDVLYEDERIIVVDKPHFLATMPRGMVARKCGLSTTMIRSSSYSTSISNGI